MSERIDRITECSSEWMGKRSCRYCEIRSANEHFISYINPDTGEEEGTTWCSMVRYCTLSKKRVETDNHEIPDWCPLEKA